MPRQEKLKKEKRPPTKRKLSFKETRELQDLPQKIEALEEEKRQLTATLNSPDFYARNDVPKVTAASDRLICLEEELEQAYSRWNDLEDLAAQSGG